MKKWLNDVVSRSLGDLSLDSYILGEIPEEVPRKNPGSLQLVYQQTETYDL